jgi:hypothetical protein
MTTTCRRAALSHVAILRMQSSKPGCEQLIRTLRPDRHNSFWLLAGLMIPIHPCRRQQAPKLGRHAYQVGMFYLGQVVLKSEPRTQGIFYWSVPSSSGVKIAWAAARLMRRVGGNDAWRTAVFVARDWRLSQTIVGADRKLNHRCVITPAILVHSGSCPRIPFSVRNGVVKGRRASSTFQGQAFRLVSGLPSPRSTIASLQQRHDTRLEKGAVGSAPPFFRPTLCPGRHAETEEGTACHDSLVHFVQ